MTTSKLKQILNARQHAAQSSNKPLRVPEIYTISQIRVRLENVDVLTFPYVGNVLFAGARASEADERQWSDLVNGKLEHRPRKSGGILRSCVPRNLLTALLPYSGCSGAMCLYGSSQRVNGIFSEHGIPLIQGGLRRSFCSYAFAYITSVLERSDAIMCLARWMGNTPARVIRHYLNTAVTTHDAIEFFGLVPAFLSEPLPGDLDVASAEKLHRERTAALHISNSHYLLRIPGCTGGAPVAREHAGALVVQESLRFLPTLPAKVTSPPDPAVVSAFPCFQMPKRKRSGRPTRKKVSKFMSPTR